MLNIITNIMKKTKEHLIVYLNGKFISKSAAKISPDDRGFTLGDGVFDTLRTYHGKLFSFDRHAARLFQGLSETKIPIPFDKNELRIILENLVCKNTENDAVVRITITRGIGKGGYKFDSATAPTVYAVTRAVPNIASLRRKGVTLSNSVIPRPLPFINVVKTISLGAMALARIFSNTYEVVMKDYEGKISECSASTLYLIKNGKVKMPFRKKILPSITCSILCELIKIEESDIAEKHLLNADALFISSTSTGPIPVSLYEGRKFQTQHPILKKIYSLYDERIESECNQKSKL